MATSLVSTGVKFPDDTIQTTAATGSVTVLSTNTFNSSGTYTKAGGANGDTVIVTVVGAGGGGGAGIYTNSTYYTGAGGGGGGGYVTVAIPYDIVPNTVSVTIGAGGAGGNTSNTLTTTGANGGISIFDKFAFATGGSGGRISQSFSFSPTQPIGAPGVGGGSRGGYFGNGNGYFLTSGTISAPGGLGTAGSCTFPTFTYSVGFGDTGGGGGVYLDGAGGNTFLEGGYDRVYGSGGNTYGASGSAPGGGGAANLNGIGGTGGDGRVIITVVSGKISAADFAAKTSNTSSGITAYYN